MIRAVAILLAVAVGPAAAWAQAACCCVDLVAASPCCADDHGATASAPDAPSAEDGCPGECARRTAELDADDLRRPMRLQAPSAVTTAFIPADVTAPRRVAADATNAPRGPPIAASRRQALLQIWTC